MRPTLKLLGIGVIAASFVACGHETPVVTPEPVAVSESLSLTNALKERLTGRFVKDGVAVDFDSVRTGTIFQFEIKAADGRSIVRGEMVDQVFRTVFFDGRLTIGYSANAAEDVAVEGDQTALDDFEKTPEYAVLPWLSHELGRLGYTGRDYPAALAMHMFNRAVAERANVVLPRADQLGRAEPEVAYCTAYPNRSNNCYGMCGPGCTCWSFVCGDCCYHYGCAKHDNYCRGSGFWDKAKCWTTWGAAFFGC